MTKRHLTIFAQVYKEKSMTRAVAALYVTQPAISQAIADLEDHYGMQLFERHVRRLELTDAGTALLVYAKDSLHLFHNAEQRLHTKEFSTIHIGANISVGTAFLPDIIFRYEKSLQTLR